MIKIENTEVYGWETAIRGLRNPMNSWSKSDSEWIEGFGYCVGKNDFELMKKLCKAGTDHRKFMRMINVTCDITAPLYWVAEHDTYKISTVRNSCSFMHKGVSKPFEINDFSVQDGDVYSLFNKVTPEIIGFADKGLLDKVAMWENIIETLNTLRDKYLETKDENIFQEIRQILPQGYNVRYTWQANYEVLANIYKSRKYHRLPEWREFCKWIEKLPYSELIVGE